MGYLTALSITCAISEQCANAFFCEGRKFDSLQERRYSLHVRVTESRQDESLLYANNASGALFAVDHGVGATAIRLAAATETSAITIVDEPR